MAAPYEGMKQGGQNMKLILQRSQKAGMMGVGKITFGLDARAQLTGEEAGYVKTYKMGKEVLYHKAKISEGAILSGGFAGLAATLAAKALDLTITVDSLVKGQHVECKDIIEMRAAEEQLKEACGVFKEVLESAAHFEGEEVIEY